MLTGALHELYLALLVRVSAEYQVLSIDYRSLYKLFYEFVELKIVILFFSEVTSEVLSAEGLDVDLPCDVTPPKSGDRINMVLWFKDEEGVPLYR